MCETSARVSPKAILGIVGERAAGVNEVQNFVNNTQGGMAKIAEKVNSGELAYVQLRSALGETMAIAWYPENKNPNIDKNRALRATPARIGEMQKGIDEGKWDIIETYNRDNVVQGLRELPGNSVLTLRTQVPLNGQVEWADAMVTISGSRGSAITVDIAPVDGKQQFRQDQIDPHFKGQMKARAGNNGERFDDVRNCVLEMFARGKYDLRLKRLPPRE